MLYGMLCHSVRVDRVDGKSTDNMHTDRGSYMEESVFDNNELMRLGSTNYVHSNFTLLEEMFFTMHSLRELSHHPADNFVVTQWSFKFPHQAVIIIYPDIVTEHKMPVPYDTACMEAENQITQNITFSILLIKITVLIRYATRKSRIKNFLKKILNSPDYEVRTLSFKWLLFALLSILNQVVCEIFMMSATTDGYALLLAVIFMLPSAINQFFIIYSCLLHRRSQNPMSDEL